MHLSLGNSEFELVEELECNKRPWETLPAEVRYSIIVARLLKPMELEVLKLFFVIGKSILKCYCSL